MKNLRLSQHCKPLVCIVGMCVILLGVLLIIVHVLLHERLLLSEWWCSSCLAFCLAWWIVYILTDYRIHPFGTKLQRLSDFLEKVSPHGMKLQRLKDFLEEVSTFRKGIKASELTNDDVKDVNEAIARKSIAAPSIVGLLMATIALFFAVISLWRPPLDNFQQGLRLLIYTAGGLSIMFLLMSVEVFDTAANLFRPKVANPQWADIEIKKYFYHGASQSFYSCGYPAFMISLILSLSFINPFIGSISVAAFAWLGYPYWWRGWTEVADCDRPYDIQEKKEFRLVGRVLGTVIGGFTILLWCFTTWCPLFASLAW